MAERRYRDLAVVVAANLVPLAGALFFGWNAFDCLALYWFENWIVFALTLAKVKTLVAHGADWGMPATPVPAVNVLRVIFFGGLYVSLTVFHGELLFATLPSALPGSDANAPRILGFLELLNRVAAMFRKEPMLVAGLLALAAGHVILYLREFVQKQDHGGLTVDALLRRTMQRVPTLHFVLLGGGAAVLFLGFGSFLPALAILVILKSLMEIGLLHWRVDMY